MAKAERFVRAQGSGHLSCLDSWLGLAVLLVLVAHFSPLSGLAAVGVELFFVLSSRLMAEMLVHREQPFGMFVWRRATRILPALAAYVALMHVVGAASSADPAMLVRSDAAALLFVSNYLIGGQILTVFQHCWSLAVEEHSYVALVLIVALARRNAAAAARTAFALASMAMAIGAWRYLASEAGDNLYFRSEIRGASILLSFAFCIHLRRHGSALSARLSAFLCGTGRRPRSIAAVALALLFGTIGYHAVEAPARRSLNRLALARRPALAG